jgi:hypothetical protein
MSIELPLEILIMPCHNECNEYSLQQVARDLNIPSSMGREVYVIPCSKTIGNNKFKIP